MTTRTRRLLAVAAVGVCLFVALSVWAVTRIVAWASDLPNRIDIQVDSGRSPCVGRSHRKGSGQHRLSALAALVYYVFSRFGDIAGP